MKGEEADQSEDSPVDTWVRHRQRRFREKETQVTVIRSVGTPGYGREAKAKMMACQFTPAQMSTKQAVCRLHGMTSIHALLGPFVSGILF